MKGYLFVIPAFKGNWTLSNSYQWQVSSELAVARHMSFLDLLHSLQLLQYSLWATLTQSFKASITLIPVMPRTGFGPRHCVPGSILTRFRNLRVFQDLHQSGSLLFSQLLEGMHPLIPEPRPLERYRFKGGLAVRTDINSSLRATSYILPCWHRKDCVNFCL